MQQHLSKRKQLALRFFTYGVMTLAVVVITVVCVMFVLGYRFSLTGNLEQRALLQFRSTPSNASILIDGEPTGLTTPDKKRQTPGEYDITMQLDGYRDWQKSVDLSAGSLLWLNYTRFVPESVSTQNVRDFEKLSDTLMSPDRRWMVASSGSGTSLTLADLRDEDQPKFSELKIPRDILEKDDEVGTLSAVEWDFGGQYLMLEHQIDDTSEIIVVDRTAPEDAMNVSRKLNIDIDKAHFTGTSSDRLFVLTQEDDVRKLNLDDGTISRPLVRNTQNFMLYRSDRIAFSAERDGKQVAGVYEDGGEEIITRTFPGDSPEVKVDLNRYYGDYYLAVAHDNEVEIIKNPFESGDAADRSFASFVFDPGVKRLTFSHNGRFVLAQRDNTFATYDLERDVHSETELAENMDGPLRWLDDYYLWTDANGTLTMLEFDGANQQEIVDVEPGYSASLSENGERMFSIGKGEDDGHVLQASEMVLED